MQFFAFVCLLLFFEKPQPSDALVEAVIAVESGGDDYAIGDTKLKHKAYGPLQIRQPCVDDVKDRLGRPNLKAEDCLGNRKLSLEIFHAYQKQWATKERLGHEPTAEDCARIWNGGPNGWKRDSTKRYWEKIRLRLEK